MSVRRAIWAEDSSVSRCTKCRAEFTYAVPKHHCRKCGLIFCKECSRNKMIVPQEELVTRPQNWFQSKLSIDLVSDEDNYRCPQRVCDPCSFMLKDLQPQLRLQVSRANQTTVVDPTTSAMSLPSVDFYMENEIAKATTMLYNFKNTLGEEKIPRELLDIAKGVVFLTIVKAGFMFTGRYGTGLVVAKLPDGRWSAPSAVMISGLGWGLQVGAEVTDVMLILSTDQAVNTFKSRAQVSVGAELGVSVGPIGRSIESDVTAGTKGAAHAFAYAQSKGLFFGASLEASGIAARPDVNRAFYGEKLKISSLLSGEYPPPKGAEPLYAAINDALFDGRLQQQQQQQQQHIQAQRGGYPVAIPVQGNSLPPQAPIVQQPQHGVKGNPPTAPPAAPINNGYPGNGYPSGLSHEQHPFQGSNTNEFGTTYEL